tara:strand:+ start:1008 stop:1730 length:723 start_codon:yes stop_codon:yes gene_type:complete
MIEIQFLLIIYFLLVITPPVVLATIFVRLDMFREPVRAVILTLIISYAATSLFGEIKYNILALPDSWYQNNFINSLFLIAFPEELTKFFVLYFYCTKIRAFNEPMDGLVYGSLAGLGFAINEAFGYAQIYQVESATITEVVNSILIRGLIAVPGHAFDGIIMGAFVGIALFRKVNKNLFFFLAILIPTIIHFLWDYSIYTGYGVFVDLIFLIELIVIIILFKRFRKYQKSKIREEELRQN